jgi:hypothetical protein
MTVTVLELAHRLGEGFFPPVTILLPKDMASAGLCPKQSARTILGHSSVLSLFNNAKPKEWLCSYDAISPGNSFLKINHPLYE